MPSNPFGQKNDSGWCECSDSEVLSEPGCGQVFSSLSGFDKHLRQGHSLEGFTQRENGHWAYSADGAFYPSGQDSKPRTQARRVKIPAI